MYLLEHAENFVCFSNHVMAGDYESLHGTQLQSGHHRQGFTGNGVMPCTDGATDQHLLSSSMLNST